MAARSPLSIWLLSPYHTGSHRAWAEGLARASRHRVRLLTMEGRFWKWRMQGGAMEMARLVEAALAERDGAPPDALIATDMVNLPALLALVRGKLPARTPVLLYMHENQLTYPWREGEKPDLTYAMINWLSQLCADRIAFNSNFHRQSWFGALPNLLKHFPDHTHLDRIAEASARSFVLPVGIDLPPAVAQHEGRQAPSLILWNQRWEYDKRPDRFFRLLYRLANSGVPYRLAVAGENFRNVPQEFLAARERLRDRIVHWGFVENRAAYEELLRSADLVISTAEHEFFGIAVLEAVAAGVFPLLPARLSYPELIPLELHPACLYRTEEELYERARLRLLEPRPAPPSLRAHVERRFAWPAAAPLYDVALEKIV